MSVIRSSTKSYIACNRGMGGNAVDCTLTGLDSYNQQGLAVAYADFLA